MNCRYWVAKLPIWAALLSIMPFMVFMVSAFTPHPVSINFARFAVFGFGFPAVLSMIALSIVTAAIYSYGE